MAVPELIKTVKETAGYAWTQDGQTVTIFNPQPPDYIQMFRDYVSVNADSDDRCIIASGDRWQDLVIEQGIHTLTALPIESVQISLIKVIRHPITHKITSQRPITKKELSAELKDAQQTLIATAENNDKVYMNLISKFEEDMGTPSLFEQNSLNWGNYHE